MPEQQPRGVALTHRLMAVWEATWCARNPDPQCPQGCPMAKRPVCRAHGRQYVWTPAGRQAAKILAASVPEQFWPGLFAAWYGDRTAQEWGAQLERLATKGHAARLLPGVAAEFGRAQSIARAAEEQRSPTRAFPAPLADAGRRLAGALRTAQIPGEVYPDGPTAKLRLEGQEGPPRLLDLEEADDYTGWVCEGGRGTYREFAVKTAQDGREAFMRMVGSLGGPLPSTRAPLRVLPMARPIVMPAAERREFATLDAAREAFNALPLDARAEYAAKARAQAGAGDGDDALIESLAVQLYRRDMPVTRATSGAA